MGATTEIAWADATFNAWIGCARVSEACDHCYADAGSKRLAAQHGIKLWDDGSTRYFTGEEYWKQPVKWNRAAQAAGVRRRVFCNSFGDVFEDRPELVDRRERLWSVMKATPWLDWLLLTKRPENADRLARAAWFNPWFPNIWLGTTTETQRHYDERWPHIARCEPAVGFVSHEPGLGRLQIIAAEWRRDRSTILSFPNWVITGGESGPHARPYDIAWARELRRQSYDTPVALFVKQLGARPYNSVRAEALDFKDRKGGDPHEWPADLRIRQFPHVTNRNGEGRS